MKAVVYAVVPVLVVSLLTACDGKRASTVPATDAAPVGAPAAMAKPPPTDLSALAQRLVNQSAAVKQGEIVMITGRAQDAELMEDIAVEVAKVGAYPMIDYSSDSLSRRLLFEVPEQFDAQPDLLGAKLAQLLDVVINLDNSTSENINEGADPNRLAARGKASEAVAQAFARNKVRRVDVGNNLYPTAWRAERFGLSQDQLAKTFWEGVNVDYSDLQARGEQIGAALTAGEQLRITNPNGTDLRVSVRGRPVGVSDGLISADDVAKGGAAVQVYLPAGEVFATPVPGSAEGKVVQTLSYYRGKQVDNLALTLVAGKVTAMTGSGEGFAALKADYDAVDDPRKNLFAYVDLGINPNIQLPANSKVGTWVPAGAVTVGVGSNLWAGGENSVPYDLSLSMPGSTVILDGKVIVENGVLKL